MRDMPIDPDPTTSVPEVLGAPLALPCGAVLANRFAKAALSEQLGTREHAPSPGLEVLYHRWACGGAGLVLTGNVMVDRTHLGEPRNVVIEDERDLDALRSWAAAGASCADTTGSQLWMQLNHPGRQAPRFLDPHPVAPSAVPVRIGRMFATPRALTGGEVEGVIESYARAARVAQQAGFAGVQLHGAHGYLISQFLSPLANVRDDEWGGDAERRMRFLLELVRATRELVGASFPIGVKLNSADFQRGGMDVAGSMQVAAALAAAGVDLLEVSGGTYERAAMLDEPRRQSTIDREAYFIDYAREVRAVIGEMPLMLTGGFRSAAGMADAVASGACDVVGLGRPLTVEPDMPTRILDGAATRSSVTAKRIGIRVIDGLAEIQWHEAQMHRLAEGREPAPRLGVLRAMTGSLLRGGVDSLRRVRG
jgi:2,4-dienoyl-CoA reductase-like NADH-dependent reductase (Old Yellow Enzyme family)